MFYAVRAKRLFLILALTILFIGVIIILSNRTVVPVFLSAEAENQTCYLIDAGHGGEDGGAVSPDGTIESELNLQIADKLEKTLRFLGMSTDMTRRDEKAVYSDGCRTLREKKRSDLKNRVEQINASENSILISIHQNSLPSAPSVYGAQMFYNSVESADVLAQQIQDTLNRSVNSGAPKKAKQISSSIYMMRQVRCPAVLAECGFLSNAEDTERLKDQNYQRKLAVAIAAGLLKDTNGATINESE